MDLLNSLTVVTISYGVSKHHRAHHKHNLCQLCFTEVRERKRLTKKDAWNSLWIFIVFAEMLAVYEHVTMPSSSIFWNTAAKSQEWTWVGQGWIVTGPWAPTAAANGISKRPLWSFSSGSVLRSECGFYERAWKPLWPSSHPASWASTAHSLATSSALEFCSLCLKYFSLRIPSDHRPPFQVSKRFLSCFQGIV